MWGWRRPEPGEGLIALLLLLVINIALLPILGIAGLMSNDEGEKTKGAIILVIGIIIWMVILFNK